MSENYKSSLHEMTQRFNTDFWNDSCSISELKYAIEYGAVGATTNPVIVKNVIKQEFDSYHDEIISIIKKNPHDTEDEIAWRIIEKTTVDGAEILKPIFDNSKGQKGRISIQTNTKFYQDYKSMTEQAIRFGELATNIQVKMPATKEGIQAMEEATYNGVSINATVSFSVSQAVAVAEAVERGLRRREAEGKDTSEMHPVCTIMVGRVGDWLKESAKTTGCNVTEEDAIYSGILVMKNAYKIFKERGYRTGLLVAAYRSASQWLEFIGGDLEMTIPHKWIKDFNENKYEITSRIDHVDHDALNRLLEVDEFQKMYNVDGMQQEEFKHLGATQATLKQFFEGYDELIEIIRKEQLVI